MHELVGGRYVLEQRIGSGGMGEVYRARHAQLGKSFALKIIASDLVSDLAARERFHREAEIASQISHPNIVSVVDFGEDTHYGVYMVMELVDGESLVNLLAGGQIPIARTVDVLGQVADALDHIHRAGVVHGDVKADNILVAPEPERPGARRRRIIKLLDFGVARRLTSTDDGLNGSPHYLAPERCLGGPATVATDIYALGVLGYLLFTRTLPFDGEVVELLEAHVTREPHSMASRRGEHIDAAIEKLITRAMAKDPATRHGSSAAFRYELNAVQSMLDIGDKRVRRLPRATRSTSRDVMLSALFDRSELAQAIITTDGTIELTNEVFEAFVGGRQLGGRHVQSTILANVAPHIVASLRAVHIAGVPSELRAHVASGREIVIWIGPTPLGTDHVHVMIWPAPRR
jgi:serine/threonine-protein kinase